MGREPGSDIDTEVGTAVVAVHSTVVEAVIVLVVDRTAADLDWIDLKIGSTEMNWDTYSNYSYSCS